ncbi:hypothetical protein B0H21DRAFT_81895 [Amylocystis lapponica]|nr:hypothetical protein B0H21DRAFT_81895 [Amylocystis lapponica]
MPEERMGRGRSPPPHPKHDRDGRSDAKDRNDIGHSNETRERRLEYYGQHIPRGTVRESRVESPQEGQPDGNDVKGKGRAPLDRPVFHERAMDVTTPRRTDTDDTSFPDAKNSICNATQIFPTVSDSYTSSAAPIPSSVPSVAASNRASSSTANIRHADFPRTTHGPSDVSGPQPAESPSNPSVVAAMSTDASGKMTALGPVRISNRNILESVQKYLAGNGSVRAQHSKNRREFAIEPSSSTPMILGERKMSSPRDRSLDTNTPYVPNISLLQHPSDPGPASSAAHRVSEFQHPPTNSVDSLRTDRHATMSAPEIMTRTRARLARLKEGASEIVSSAPSIASLSIDEHPEKGKPARQSANASADGLVERKSGPISITSPLPNQSPNLDHPYGTAESDTISTSTLTSTLRTSRSTSSSGTSALQREALLRKLAAEKRRQDHPTSTSDSLPANSRAHSISNESVPMGVHSGNNADHLDLTQVPPPETSPVARAAEREATLRSQAQKTA